MTNQTLEQELLVLREDINVNKTDGVEERINQLLKRCIDSGESKLLGRIIWNKASFLSRTGQFDEAIRSFKEAYKYFLFDHNSQLQVSLLNELGTTYLDLGQDDEAMECFFRALDILNKEKTYDVTRASIANNLGTAYFDLNDYEKAKSFFEEAYNLLVEEQSTVLLPIVTFNLAESYYYLNEKENCMKFIGISKSLSMASDDRLGMTFTNAMEAIVAYDDADNLDVFLSKYNECIEMMTEEGEITTMIELNHMFCQVLHKHKAWDALQPNIEALYQNVLEVEVVSRLNSISQMLKDLYIAKGDYKSAYEVLERDVESKNAKIEKLENKQYKQVDENYQQITNQHYVDRLEDSVRIFKLLSEVGNGITLNKDIKGIFDYIVDHIYSIWALDVFGVAIIDEEDDSIKYYYNTIEDGNRVGKRSRSNEGVLMNYCINHNAEIVINDATLDVEYKNKYPEAVVKQMKEATVKSLIFSPMVIGNKVIGGITVQSNHSDYFNSGAIEVVRTFGAYCSTAIVNHQRHLKLQKMKDIDGLTGAYNRHALINFNNDLDQYPKKKELPLFMAMLDIDYFKQYNDNYGHTAGDVCIVQVVQIMDEVVRRYGGDLYRYGGDEFNIIVEGCDNKRAEEILDKILERLDDVALTHEYSRVSSQVTLSIGGVVIEALDQFLSEYYLQMDRLLYEVKGRGRNGYKIETVI